MILKVLHFNSGTATFNMRILVSFLLIYFYLKPSIATTKKNVLLIVVDDLRPSIGAYGDLQAVTPNIDEIANSGFIFLQAFAQQALCAPSRNSFLTSRRPDTLHLYDINSYWRTFAGNFTTLPQYFKENNYFTKSIGKIFHPGKSSNYNDDYPYSWSEKPWHPSTEKYKDKRVCKDSSGLHRNLVCPVDLKDQPEGTLPDIQSKDEAIKFLASRANATEPFFLAVGFHKPHIPLKFPEKYLDLHPIDNITLPSLPNYPPCLPTIAWSPWNDIRKRDDIAALELKYPFASMSDDWIKKIRQAYFASVSYIDDLIGDLMQNLTGLNLDENTIVVLLGDHGWSLGEHGEWAKYSNFDTTLRVPLIFRIPGVTYFPNNTKISTGSSTTKIVELVDVFPTVVDLAGLKPIPNCSKKSKSIICTEGKSRAALIKGTENSSVSLQPIWGQKVNYAFSQYPRPGVTPTRKPNSDEPKMNEIKFMGYSVRTPMFRYTQWIFWDSKTLSGDWNKVNQTELYDLLFDPEENLNIAGRPGLEDVQRNLTVILKKKFLYLD